VLTDRNGVPFPPVRRLGPPDLAHCVALSLDRGWAPEKAKWALLLEAAEGFGVDAAAGGLAGCVVLARYGPDLASVGMMLVAARYGRRGLGRALMEHLLAAAGGATVTLFATDQGRPLYEKLGFRAIRRNVAFVGTFRPERPERPEGPEHGGGNLTRLATEADMPAILDIDKAAFGADRSRLLLRLPGFAEQLRVIGTGSAVAGYAAAWRTETATVIGPVVAPDDAAARQLITGLATRAHGQVRLDLDPDRPELPRWAFARGLQPVSRNAVMAYGDWRPRGEPGRLFTPFSVALALRMIERILPSRIAAAESFGDDPAAELFPQEKAVIARASEKRRQEFATTRACARAALDRLGLPAAPVLPGPNGAPQWPAGVTGSITHCAGYRAVAVALTRDIVSLGVDAEPNEALPSHGILKLIALAEERDRLTELSGKMPGISWDRLLFSAKESVYKTWFPLTQRWLGFESADILIDPRAGTFTARLLVPGPFVNGAPLSLLNGRWLADRGLLLTAIAVPAVRVAAELP
jgi:4'-phosphopantetheinyl transferase EntD/predicted N-acetyltransferase YhbS